jgi:hypothetical protein
LQTSLLCSKIFALCLIRPQGKKHAGGVFFERFIHQQNRLAVGWPGQVLEEKSQCLLQIFYRFLFRRTATFQIKIGEARDENTVFLDNYIVRALLEFLGFHGEKYVAVLVMAQTGQV